MGHARAIINIDSVEEQKKILDKIIREDLSVRKVETIAKELQNPYHKKNPTDTIHEVKDRLFGIIDAMADDLISEVGLSVNSNGDGGGVLSVKFNSEEDLERIASHFEKKFK